MCYCGIDKTYIISTHFLFRNFFFGFIFYVAHLFLKQAVQSSDDQNCFYLYSGKLLFLLDQSGWLPDNERFGCEIYNHQVCLTVWLI
jgi:hypothetical protein